MSNWFRSLDSQLPAATMLLAQVTALLIAGLAVQQIIRRSPAARHAVLLWTLIAVALCPVLVAAVRLAAIPTPFMIRNSVKPLNVLFGSHGAAQAIQPGFQTATTHHLPLAGFFIALWGTGTLLSLLARFMACA